MSKWPWSAFDKWNILVVIVTQIYHNGEPSHGGDSNIFKVMTSPLPKGTLDFNNFRVSSILYHGNPDRSHKHSNIVEWYILHMQVLLEWCYAYMESSHWENWNHLFRRRVSFLTAPHYRFWGVGQDMKPTYLYLWYHLFQAQWDRSDQHNYLVKGHHLHSGTWT